MDNPQKPNENDEQKRKRSKSLSPPPKPVIKIEFSLIYNFIFAFRLIITVKFKHSLKSITKFDFVRSKFCIITKFGFEIRNFVS